MGTISIEHGDHLYWLGRYTERSFTTLKVLHKIFDRMIDEDHCYTEYLSCFGLSDIYEDNNDFIRHFLYDKNNPNSLAFSLERAYDNGIVLREEISTEALSFLQMAKDTLKKSEKMQNPRLSLISLEDNIYGFWGCIYEYIYDAEIKNIIKCGKSLERLDLYLRLDYPYRSIRKAYSRLTRNLESIPENTPYRYNSKFLDEISNAVESADKYDKYSSEALTALEHIFDRPEVSA
ncbi:MAG: alpha-E domain-containing protein [Oscillospiraceae bacterium]|nr:alpha-E domain-containing protein [Oscillospiraceae bacterium]